MNAAILVAFWCTTPTTPEKAGNCAPPFDPWTPKETHTPLDTCGNVPIFAVWAAMNFSRYAPRAFLQKHSAGITCGRRDTSLFHKARRSSMPQPSTLTALPNGTAALIFMRLRSLRMDAAAPSPLAGWAHLMRATQALLKVWIAAML